MGTTGEMTKGRILDTTISLIHENGIEATSINEIIKTADITKGCLFFHFKDKQTLVSQAIDKHAGFFFDMLDKITEGSTPKERLSNFFDGVLELHRSRGFAGGCIFGNTALEAADSNDVYSAQVINVFDKWTEKLTAILQEASEYSEIRPDIIPAEAASAIINALEGGIMLARLKKDGTPLINTISAMKFMLDI